MCDQRVRSWSLQTDVAPLRFAVHTRDKRAILADSRMAFEDAWNLGQLDPYTVCLDDNRDSPTFRRSHQAKVQHPAALKSHTEPMQHQLLLHPTLRREFRQVAHGVSLFM